MALVKEGMDSKEAFKIDLRFGQEDDLLQALTLMSTKREHAKRIGRGAKAIAEDFGKEDLFMGVRGIPMAPFDPRAIQGMGLHFATSNYGPHHLYAYTFIDEVLNVHENLDPTETEGKPELVKRYQDTTAIMDSLGLCNWPLMGLKFQNMVPMVNSCLGTGFKAHDLLEIGERIWNLERIFNTKASREVSEDTLPARFFEEPLPEGPAEGHVSKVKDMLPEYYNLRGWDETGTPRAETLNALKLEG
jgi:aldehyde:ferredoxin oxidoreductase